MGENPLKGTKSPRICLRGPQLHSLIRWHTHHHWKHMTLNLLTSLFPVLCFWTKTQSWERSVYILHVFPCKKRPGSTDLPTEKVEMLQWSTFFDKKMCFAQNFSATHGKTHKNRYFQWRDNQIWLKMESTLKLSLLSFERQKCFRLLTNYKEVFFPIVRICWLASIWHWLIRALKTLKISNLYDIYFPILRDWRVLNFQTQFACSAGGSNFK